MPGAAYTPRCECVSMTPGVIHLPLASMTSASAGAVTVCPTAAILPFCSRIDPRSIDRAGRGQDRRVADQRGARGKRLVGGWVHVRHQRRRRRGRAVGCCASTKTVCIPIKPTASTQVTRCVMCGFCFSYCSSGP